MLCAGIKLHIKLTLGIKCLSANTKQFKIVTKEFLLACNFYSIDEFIPLCNKTVLLLHEIMITQCLTAAPHVLVLVIQSTNSGSR